MAFVPRLSAAADLYATGMTLRETAERLGLPWSADVRRILIDAGVVRRRRGPRGRVDVPDALLRELRDEERLSFAAIAEVTGMSKSGVRHRFERMRDGRQRRW